jgi:type I restriction enzyme S subunit
MAVVELGDICEFLDHKRKPVSEELRNPGPYPYYGANGQQGWIDDYIFDETLVLLAEDGGHFGSKTRPIAYKICGKTWVNNHAHVLRPFDGCDADYLTHVLSFYDVTKLISGTTRPKLTKANAEVIQIPLPSLPEQQRIARRLDQADRLRRIRCYALDLSDTFLPAAFLEVFGDFNTNPKNWPIFPLGDLIVDGPQNGLYKPASSYGSGTPILRIDAFYDGMVTDMGGLKRVRLSAGELSSYRLHPKDIVINRVNSRSHLGKSAIIPSLREPTVFESNMMRFAVDEERIHTTYLIHALQTGLITQQIQLAAKDAVNQASINQEDVLAFKLPVPPFAVQQTFVELVERLECLRSVQRESLRQAEHLFQSLLHRAFGTEQLSGSEASEYLPLVGETSCGQQRI